MPMNTHTDTLPDRVIFLADVHLGLPGDTKARADRFAAFLHELKGTISHLYIVGDLFDFWFEYRSAIPNTAPQVICELYRLVRSGTKVILLAGNHDYWLGPYLRDGIGAEIVPDDIVVEHQGLKILVHHGDGLYPNDHGYRILKRVLRSPVSIALFRMLHPDFARKIAALTSTTSRKYLAPPVNHDEHYSALFRDIADERLAKGYDAVVFGHSHVPLLERRPAGTLALLGDWINRSTYLVLENGEFSLREWNGA